MTSPEWEAANEDDSDRFPQPSPHVAPRGWDMRGGSLWFDREEWGVIIDALIQHRGNAARRKAANSESTSDVRADVCTDLVGKINEAAAAPAEQREPECDMTEDGKHADGGIDPDWNEQICAACNDDYEPAEGDGRG